MAAGVISLFKRHPDLGSSPTPFSTLILGSGVEQTCRAPAHGKGSQCSLSLLKALLHKLWARPCAGCGRSEGKASPPPRGAHLRGTNICTTARTENVERPWRGLEVHRKESCPGNRGQPGEGALAPSHLSQRSWAAVQQRHWPPGSHCPSALSRRGPCPQGLVCTRRMLFSAVDTRGRAATCRKARKGAQMQRKEC